MRYRIAALLVILLTAMIFIGQTAEAAWPWDKATPTPTPTRFVTSTPVPTHTPRPVNTPTRFITSTPVPSFTPTRVILNTPIIPMSTPVARATQRAQSVATSTPVATNTPFLSITVEAVVPKRFVVTAIPPGTADVYVSCTNCTSIYYSYPVPFDMRRGYTFSGSTLSVSAGTSLYTKPIVGFDKQCLPASDERIVSAGYNRIPDFLCSDK